MKYVELFAGVGGFRLGIERAFSVRDGQTEDTRTSTSEQSLESASTGVRDNRNRPMSVLGGDTGPVLCVLANEWDKYAAQTYNKNFNSDGSGGQIDQRDIREIATSEIPDHDLLVGGFPCQAFSVAGKRGGFDDTRGTMFFEIARILADKKPQHLLLENVKGLLSHDGGRTFQTIVGILADLGYRVEWQVLNSKDFGVPQNRERVLIVGHLGACCGRQVFPISGSYGASVAAYTLRAHQGGVSERDNLVASHLSYEKGINPSETAVTLLSRDYKGIGNRQESNGAISAGRIRRLTPVECERLQGFPDGWTAGVSDTQRYKQMGNAVTTNVIQAVVEALYAD